MYFEAKLNLTVLPHQFPFPFPLEKPLDRGLRRAWLTLQECAASLDTKLHCFFKSLLHYKKLQSGSCLKRFYESRAFTLNKNCPTFSIESSALPQWISMFDILPSAPPETKKKIIFGKTETS